MMIAKRLLCKPKLSLSSMKKVIEIGDRYMVTIIEDIENNEIS